MAATPPPEPVAVAERGGLAVERDNLLLTRPRDHRPWSAVAGSLPDSVTLPARHLMLGVLPGEGIGPEVTDAALEVLHAVERVTDMTLELHEGGPIGFAARKACGEELSPEVAGFCAAMFARGGAVLAGPGGGRFVYDLRRRLDLFWKLNPVRPLPWLAGAGAGSPPGTLDILIVRETTGGVYQGEWTEHAADVAGERLARHSFGYSERQVRRVLEVAARLARERRGELAVVVKRDGVPSISRLWMSCAEDVAREHGVTSAPLDIDYAAYRLIQQPQELDVVAAPNLFGDVLADLGAVLLGSRGLSYGATFGDDGAAVFQTNHGAAYDIAGSDRANPIAQILSLALLLAERRHDEAALLVERAVAAVLAAGWRTEDIAAPGCSVVGTAEMGGRIARTVAGFGRQEE